MLPTAKFILSVTCLIWGSIALRSRLTMGFTLHQETGFISTTVGENATLHCSYDAGVELAWLFWYKQPFGQQPHLISSVYVFGTDEYFFNEFKNNQRFTLKKGNTFYHLTISDLQISDSGTYYCASSFANNLQFPEGVTVFVRQAGLTLQAWIDQSVLGSVKLGGSVTLCCDIHMESCDGERSVYWLRNSAMPHSRILYEGRQKEHENKSNKKTCDCVYCLDLKGLNRSHAGNYYCALVASGYILFGKGTVLDFDDEVKSQVVVYFLIGALTLTTILVVSLSGLVHKMNQKNSFQSTGADVDFSTNATTSEDDKQDTDNLHYAAVSMNTFKKLRRQRTSSNDNCVYSSMKK